MPEKRAFTIILTVLLLVAALPFAMKAEADISVTSRAVGAEYGSHSIPFGIYEYDYDQLDKYGKSVYCDLKNNILEGKMDFDLSWPDSLTLFLTVPEGQSLEEYISSPESEVGRFNDLLANSMQSASEALLLDHPEIFWLDVTGSSINTRVRAKASGNGYSVTLSPVFSGAYRGNSGFGTDLTFDSMMSAVSDFTVTGESEYGILKQIHDYICNTVTYGGNGDDENTAASALVNGISRCEGYGKAFKLFCDKYGIPCVCAVGVSENPAGQTEGHLWNYVRLSDGKWYAVDVTWDDQSKIYYDFFLVGSDTVAPNFRAKAFRSTHTETPYVTGEYSVMAFSFPRISATAYTGQIQEESPPQPATEVTTQPVTEVPTVPMTESPTQPETEPFPEESTTPVDPPIQYPTLLPQEHYTEKPTEKDPPVQPQTSPETEPETESPTFTPAEYPSEISTEHITEPQSEYSTENSTRIPSEDETFPLTDTPAVSEEDGNRNKTLAIAVMLINLTAVVLIILRRNKRKTEKNKF